MEQSSGWKKLTEDMGIENRTDTNLAHKRTILATGRQGNQLRGETQTGSRLAQAGTGTGLISQSVEKTEPGFFNLGFPQVDKSRRTAFTSLPSGDERVNGLGVTEEIATQGQPLCVFCGIMIDSPPED